MKIGIYNESTSDDSILGGSEVVAALMAHTLHRHCGPTGEIEFVHHHSVLQREQLERLSGVDLDAIGFRYLPRQAPASTVRRNFSRRYQVAKSWHRHLSAPYDLFIAIVHNTPPFCHAPNGLLMVLFPFVQSPVTAPPQKQRARWYVRRPAKLLERPYLNHEWQSRLDSYQFKTAISEFTRQWTQLWWQTDTQVIYPPVDVDYVNYQERARRDQILSVGRFTGRGVLKRQLEMMETFVQIPPAQLNDWRYLCAGGLGEAPEDLRLFDDVRRRAGEDGRAEVKANIDRDELKRAYQQSKIFWHATGWGEDEELNPQMAEHFGISTVEAMAAGCVPIVINKGAQPEIVQHGENGFVWNTPQELESYTVLVARDEALRQSLSRAARERAQYFSRQMFAQRVLETLAPVLEPG